MLLKNMSPLGGGGERLIVNGICPLGNHSQQRFDSVVGPDGCVFRGGLRSALQCENLDA